MPNTMIQLKMANGRQKYCRVVDDWSARASLNLNLAEEFMRTHNLKVGETVQDVERAAAAAAVQSVEAVQATLISQATLTAQPATTAQTAAATAPPAEAVKIAATSQSASGEQF